MRGGKAIAEEQVAKKPSGKEMFLRHLVAEEAEVAEGEEEENGEFFLLVLLFMMESIVDVHDCVCCL